MIRNLLRRRYAVPAKRLQRPVTYWVGAPAGGMFGPLKSADEAEQMGRIVGEVAVWNRRAYQIVEERFRRETVG